MKNLIAPNIPVIVLCAALAVVAFRAAARRRGPQRVPGTEPVPVTATGRPASAVEQMQQVFHELHPDGRHALCVVCDGQ